MNYEIDFVMPVVQSGHTIGLAEGTVHIKTFGGLWWITDSFLRDQDTNQLFKLDKDGPMLRVVETWIEVNKDDHIQELIKRVAA